VIYVCTSCKAFTFLEWCEKCGDYRHPITNTSYSPITSPAATTCVPLHPRFYPDFRYSSQGFIKDWMQRKKETRKLEEIMSGVLEKYERFKEPYFVNFLHILRGRELERSEPESGDSQHIGRLELFKRVLAELGFNEIGDFPGLAERLLLTTEFSFAYGAFCQEITEHVVSDLNGSLHHWIDEQGASFRRELPLFLYYVWENNLFQGQVDFQQPSNPTTFTPLVGGSEYERIERICENIYMEMRIARFKNLLENFDSSRYLTIYKVDGMTGHEFESFLAKLFLSIGFDVEETRETQDQGADLFVSRFGRRTVIQAKRYSENVGNAAVQQAIAAMHHFGCDGAMVVTNSFFTKAALELAESTSVRLIDRDALKEMLEDYNQTLIEGDEELQVQSES